MSDLNPSKTAGPDGTKPEILRELANEIAPILQIIMTKSRDTGCVPRSLPMSLLYTKKSHNPDNYKPLSLTCIYAESS